MKKGNDEGLDYLDEMYTCKGCKKEISESETYEYRGVFSCEDCHESVINDRNYERNQIIQEEDNKAKRYKHLDIDPNSIIGKANREIFAKELEISSKESQRLFNYERGE